MTVKKSKAHHSNLINLTFKNKYINLFLANKIAENSKNIIFNYVFFIFLQEEKRYRKMPIQLMIKGLAFSCFLLFFKFNKNLFNLYGIFILHKMSVYI